MSEKTQNIIEGVEGGVAYSLDEICRTYGECSFDELTVEEQQELDAELFTCEICGWLQPSENLSEIDCTCTDCAEE